MKLLGPMLKRYQILNLIEQIQAILDTIYPENPENPDVFMTQNDFSITCRPKKDHMEYSYNILSMPIK